MKREEFIQNFLKEDGWAGNYQSQKKSQLERAEQAYNCHLAKLWLDEVDPPQFGVWWRWSPRDFTSNGQWEELYYHPKIGLIFAYRHTSGGVEVVRTSQNLKDLSGCKVFQTDCSIIKTGKESW